jgi:hypothetical protein
MKSRQRVYEYEEGTDAARRFESAVTRVLRVSKEELAKREETYQKSRAQKDRPSPKRRPR